MSSFRKILTFEEPMTFLQLGTQSNQCTKVGSMVTLSLKSGIKEVLQRNVDLFAWSPTDMPNINLEFTCHKLALQPEAKPITQQK